MDHPKHEARDASIRSVTIVNVIIALVMFSLMGILVVLYWKVYPRGTPVPTIVEPPDAYELNLKEG